MQTVLTQVSVWLDALAPEAGAFAHGLEWAARLGLPLQARVQPLCPTDRRFGRDGSETTVRRSEFWEKTVRACVAACSEKGVSCVAFPGFAPAADAQDGTETRTDLRVLSAVDSDDGLLREAAECAVSPVLLCSSALQSASRVLIVHEHEDAGSPFLLSALRICRALKATIVVLSFGHSMSEAQLRQQRAEETIASEDVPAYFDLVAGQDVGAAVASLARWRRCTHVFVEKRCTSGWRRRMRWEADSDLLDLCRSRTLFALPNAEIALPIRSERRRDRVEPMASV
jgi:hypothetical protein